jgi:membrane protein
LLWAARNFVGDGLFNQCAAISYYALLSVAPFLSLLAATLGYVLGSAEQGMEAAVARIDTLVPDMPPLIVEVAASFAQYRGTIGVAALVVTLWVSHLVFASIETAVSQIFRRPLVAMDWQRVALRTLWEWIKPFLLFFAAASMLVLSFALDSILTVVRTVQTPLAWRILDFIEGSTTVSILTSLIAGIVVFALVLQALTPQWLSLKVLLPSAIVGSILWEVASGLFSSYLRYAASVRSFTGGAGAVVLFMLWIYYAAIVLLFSLQVAAVLSGDRAGDGATVTDPEHTM